MTSRRRLFIAALIAGGMFRLGIPGIADLVSYAWARAEPVSRSLLPGQEGLIALAGIGILAFVGYLNYDIFFKGAKKGKRGFLLVIYGFLAGFFLASAGIALAGLG
ncbi:hypothetical protein J2741_002069 [Methanolinea mesophila]|uniref:hypothetical protein n=1 Tax=Methanolinea mesophila TaxID=547055 RepID=UPI001AE81974|nr:hypothetical protein [Methanolinea mesophila]MBP1929522.1 hypothetical protein [Methanolinea mesophila]